MAVFHSHFFSDVLGMQSQVTVIVPQGPTQNQVGLHTVETKKEWPCLWLLHGLSDDHTSWLRRTSIERYAEAAGIAVVMPNVHRSFYSDMKYGGNYWTYLTEELPGFIQSVFPICTQPKHHAVAGLSMGGYGAIKWLLRKPDRFCAGASLSGVMDLAQRFEDAKQDISNSLRLETLRLVFGDTFPAGSEEDLLALLTKHSERASSPPILQICGTEDFLYPDNLTFKATAESVGYPIDYVEKPGEHSWEFWDAEIQTVLRWLSRQGFGSFDN